MGKNIWISILLLCTVHSLYTSSYWSDKGIDVRDQFIDESKIKAAFLQTSCNDVDLSAAPFNHNGVVMSGYLNVNKVGSGLGFILYGKAGAPKADLKKYPTVLWLNGGPGSSSQLGNFMELGPHFVRPAAMAPYEVVKNNYTWIKQYNVIFVDQPVGTGLSYADPTHPSPYCKNMNEVANDFYYALNELYNNPNGCFSKIGITGSHPLFVFGESYAGKYAPAIAQKIKSQQLNKDGFLKGLKGVAIGDGFTHPYHILTQVGEFAFNLGLIDYQQRSTIEHVILNATAQFRRRQWRELHDSFDLTIDLLKNMSGGINVYDITKYKPYPDQIIGQFLESPDNKKLFKLNNDVEFGAQSGNVYEGLYEDFMLEYEHLVEMLLQEKVNVMIYSGQNDLIVETPGTFKWTEMLHFDKADQFRNTLMKPWKVAGQVAGFNKIAGYLQLRTVNDAGHLVPMDQGERALELVKDFVQRSIAA